MSPRQPRYAKQEHFIRCDDLYQQLWPRLEAAKQGGFVAIDIDSGAYEVADDPRTAGNRLFERIPEALIWCVRILDGERYRVSPLGPRGETGLPPRGPRYPKEEHARKGQEIYEQIRPQVEVGNHGRVVAIDIDTGAYEVAVDDMIASHRLLARLPDAQIWCVRIGYPAVEALRGRSLSGLRRRTIDVSHP